MELKRNTYRYQQDGKEKRLVSHSFLLWSDCLLTAQSLLWAWSLGPAITRMNTFSHSYFHFSAIFTLLTLLSHVYVRTSSIYANKRNPNPTFLSKFQECFHIFPTSMTLHAYIEGNSDAVQHGQMDTTDEEPAHWLQKDNDKLDFRVALSYDDYWGTFDDDNTSEDTNTTSKDGDDFNSSVQFTLVEPEWLNKVSVCGSWCVTWCPGVQRRLLYADATQ